MISSSGSGSWTSKTRAGTCAVLVGTVDQRTLELLDDGVLGCLGRLGFSSSTSSSVVRPSALSRSSVRRLGTACSGVLVTTSRPKATTSDQQRRHDVRALEQVDQHGGEQEADRTAGLTHRVGVGVAGARHTVRQVHESEDAADDRAPADDLTTGRAVAIGVTQRAPGDHDEQHGNGPGKDADAAGA